MSFFCEGNCAEAQRLAGDCEVLSADLQGCEDMLGVAAARADQAEGQLREMREDRDRWVSIGEKAEEELSERRISMRSAAQALIAEIGAPGPEALSETVLRAVERLKRLEHLAYEKALRP